MSLGQPATSAYAGTQGQPEITLSIAVFTFNRDKILATTLRALQAQVAALGVSDIELVVCDNASPDDTETVARSFSDKFPHFQYYRQATNVGSPRNYFRVTQLSRGRYVWPYSDDDLPVEGAVRRMLELARQGRAAFILGNYSLFSWGTGKIHLERVLSLPQDRSFPTILEMTKFVGLFEALTLTSVAIFERAPFVAVDPEIYLTDETWFAYVYAFLEAFARRESMVFADPIVLHNVDEHRWRIQWRETHGRGHLYIHTIGTLRGMRILRGRGIVPPTFLADVQEPEVKSYEPRVEVVQSAALIVLRRLAAFALGEMQEQRNILPEEWQLATEEFAALQRPDLFLLLRQINLTAERLRIFQEIIRADVAVLEQYAGL